MKSDIRKKISKALAKKAVGYDAKEIVEEYQDDEGTLRLTKKKITKKHIPPDTQAARIVLESMENKSVSSMTDEQLNAEKERIINLLKENEHDDKKS